MNGGQTRVGEVIRACENGEGGGDYGEDVLEDDGVRENVERMVVVLMSFQGSFFRMVFKVERE